MISKSSLAVASNYAVAADWISDPLLDIHDLTISPYSITIAVDDARSALHAFDRLHKPGSDGRPKVTVSESAERSDQFGRHAFVMIKACHSKDDRPDVEMIVSLFVTDPADLDLTRSMEGLALLETLASAVTARKDN